MQSRSLTIGVLRERRAGERRVALVPADVKRLASRVAIYVEQGAGAGAGLPDSDYVVAGATVASYETVIGRSDVLVKVRAPESAEGLRAETVLISLGGRDTHVISMLAA